VPLRQTPTVKARLRTADGGQRRMTTDLLALLQFAATAVDSHKTDELCALPHPIPHRTRFARVLPRPDKAILRVSATHGSASVIATTSGAVWLVVSSPSRQSLKWSRHS